ncbi:MAG TPA: c-type cytochrome [Edaphobacter sp.]|nr:c-type cytochrome [Edaphobacter sp.]
MLKPSFALVALLPLSVFAFQQPQQPAAAPASSAIPADAAKMVNPVKPTPESLAHAKKMYGYDCAMCHGATGNGKGDLAADMKPPLKDYTDAAALKDISDGEMFYIIKNGKGQMPGEGDRLKTDDVWNMVLLVRSFSKKP